MVSIHLVLSCLEAEKHTWRARSSLQVAFGLLIAHLACAAGLSITVTSVSRSNGDTVEFAAWSLLLDAFSFPAFLLLSSCSACESGVILHLRGA